MDFTVNQLEAIKKRGDSLIVSASAGSGKTTVMISRIVELCIKEKVPIKKMLVLTFTESAAADMKLKLQAKLAQHLYEQPNNTFIADQLENVDVSNICTIHSFCNSLLRRYFHQMHIDPTFEVLSKQQSDSYKRAAIKKTLDYFYASGGNDFYDLFDIFGRKRGDDTLAEAILQLHEFSLSHSDAEKWLDSSASFYSAKGIDKVLQTLNSHIAYTAQYYRDKMSQLSVSAVKNDMEGYSKALNVCAEIFGRIDAKNSLDYNIAVLMQSLPKFPPVRNGDEQLKSQCKAVKKNAAKFAEQFQLPTAKQMTADCNSAAKYVKLLRSAVDRFSKEYQETKAQNNCLDFNDLEHKALQLLKEMPQIKEQFSYIFVDEYQDINSLQEEIFDRLNSGNNMFFVGDVKQSIYAFRLSEPSIFSRRNNLYKQQGKSIILNHNFRSDRNILNFVNYAFENIMTEEFGGVNYKDDAMLLSGRQQGSLSQDPNVEIFVVEQDKDRQSSAEVQGLAIANKIVDTVGSCQTIDGTRRQVGYGDIVILMRSMTGSQASDIYKQLKDAGIPVAANFKEKITGNMEIYLLTNFLRLIDNSINDIALLTVMRSIVFEFDENQLAQIRGKYRGSFYNACCNYLQTESDGELRKKLQRFFDTINKYKLLSNNTDVYTLLNTFIIEFDYNILVLSLVNGNARYSRLQRYLDTLANNAAATNLRNYIKHLNDVDDISIDAVPETANCVRMMTMHASKGLEFPIVFVAALDTQFNTKDSSKEIQVNKDFGVGIKCYDTANRTFTNTAVRLVCELENRKIAIQEELRLLYVAFTRAKSKLYITTAMGEQHDYCTHPVYLSSCTRPIDFFYQAFNQQSPLFKLTRFDGKQTEQPEKPNLIYGNQIDQNAVWILNYAYPHEAATKLNYKMAVSQINQAAYQAEESSVSIPIMYGESAAAKGTAYHAVMQHINFDADIATIDKLIENLKQSGLLEQEVKSDIIYKAIQSQVLQQAVNKTVRREQPFIALLPSTMADQSQDANDKIIVQGIIDLLIIDGDEVTVVDYKFSAHNNDTYFKEHYAKQLDLYAYACQKILNKRVKSKIILNLRTGDTFNI